MKYLLLVLLLTPFTNTTRADVPKVCFDTTRQYYFLLSVREYKFAKIQLDKAADVCDFDSIEYAKELRQMYDNDKLFKKLVARVQKMDLPIYIYP